MNSDKTSFCELFDVPAVPAILGGKTGNNDSLPPVINPCYRYVFTINNWTESELCQLKLSIPKISKKCVLGFEVGESGTPHIQGVIFLIRKMRITGLTGKAGFERAWCQKCDNPNASIDYCRKDGIFWDYGFPKPVKVIETLRPWQADILKIYLDDPDDRVIHWYWEETGKIGKSSFIKYMAVKHSILLCTGGKHTDIMNLVFNQDMDNCRAVMFDIPRSHEGKISYASLECIKNGMVCNTKYETGVKIFNSPHIFVFANFPPDDESKMSADRWIITEL